MVYAGSLKLWNCVVANSAGHSVPYKWCWSDFNGEDCNIVTSLSDFLMSQSSKFSKLSNFSNVAGWSSTIAEFFAEMWHSESLLELINLIHSEQRLQLFKVSPKFGNACNHAFQNVKDCIKMRIMEEIRVKTGPNCWFWMWFLEYKEHNLGVDTQTCHNSPALHICYIHSILSFSAYLPQFAAWLRFYDKT